MVFRFLFVFNYIYRIGFNWMFDKVWFNGIFSVGVFIGNEFDLDT